MSHSQIEFTLKLIPIITQDELISPTDQSQHDDWLNNDDAGLLNAKVSQDDEKKDEHELNQILGQLANHSEHRIFQKETLEIKTTTNGFELVDGDEHIVLQDDDIIRLPTALFKVKIQKEHIVKYDAETANDNAVISSAPEIEDIWSSSHDTNYKGNRFADPFAASANAAKKGTFSSQQDPLDFLYDPHSETKANILQPVINEQSSFTDNGLAINTKQSYHPAQSGYSEPQYLNSSAPSSEGNVLNDLGIDEASSTIAQKNYHSGKTSYLEQSPMDMLDEYLDSNETISYDSSIPNSPPQSFRSQEPFGVSSSDPYIQQNTTQRAIQSPYQGPSKQPSVSSACKKLFKAFID